VLEVNEKTLRITHEMTNDETGELAAVRLFSDSTSTHVFESCPLTFRCARVRAAHDRRSQ
jgi:hypothetical protein